MRNIIDILKQARSGGWDAAAMSCDMEKIRAMKNSSLTVAYVFSIDIHGDELMCVDRVSAAWSAAFDAGVALHIEQHDNMGDDMYRSVSEQLYGER